MGEKFSGARQGVRYRGNGGRGTHLLTERHYNDDPGQMHLFDASNDAIHAESVEYGQHTPQRKHDPVTQWNGQMALPGMPKPSDPHLHRLRQENPNLNDYQFDVEPRRVTVRDPSTFKRVGMMKLGYAREGWLGESHDQHREVEEIAVAPRHQGKGLGEAMYDLARMKGTKIVHSTERSESGESFAQRVGGPQFQRKQGHGQDDYLGHDPDPDKV